MKIKPGTYVLHNGKYVYSDKQIMNDDFDPAVLADRAKQNKEGKK